MGFYRDTWKKVETFNEIIDTIPISSKRLGTILIETNVFRNYLMELPKKIILSIRHNVTSTMEQETKLLKEELFKAKESLE